MTQAMQIERRFPEEVKRGKMSTTVLAEIVIDGKLRLHTAGLRIYGDDNLIKTPASVDVSNVVVNYLENEFGEIEKIWILTLEESKVALPKKN
ncbi:hypothetical protein [Undibacterium fentianense]|uniref:Uncharacterized protein n=1 Tax=Undibacterium fentianense TaxID=2828728 RepID=A0A941E7I9_9BURK|nr:hypothetical protein [Undibacterium fentianense]MBR7801178.1 hypothetical protein [Undibacterium fentianense]